MKKQDEPEVFCYESREGLICLEMGGSEIRFSSKRFLEFADKLNKGRQLVLENYLHRENSKPEIISSYRI